MYQLLQEEEVPKEIWDKALVSSGGFRGGPKGSIEPPFWLQ